MDRAVVLAEAVMDRAEAATSRQINHWVPCRVRLPDSAVDIACDGRISCPDVVDALELDRWTSMAFVELWHLSTTSSTRRRRRLCRARWYLDRALREGIRTLPSTNDLIAAVLEEAATQCAGTGADAAQVLRDLGASFRSQTPEASHLFAEAYGKEIQAARNAVGSPLSR